MVANPGVPYTPAMSVERVEDLVWELEPEELPDALRLLTSMEQVGWASPQEADAWRGQIAAFGICWADPRLWGDGVEA